MTSLLPQQIFSLAPNVGKTFYENAAGIHAHVSVNNFSDVPISLVITRLGATPMTRVIPRQTQQIVSVRSLQIVALLTGSSPAFGTIYVATMDD
ncbi:hypothetical protein JCM10914A_15650 [Paenibacillus sp. JCM 10914]|uniref:hypothetical protein n=1 Tax=Paenibacillus sp. JCM 10914 TaxID=1236974 RepID=UPI00056544BD|nr:hypothetical protein [Paenibacillus sp. JCM 10914]